MNGNDTTTSVGQRAEDVAVRTLEQHGLTVLARNFHCRGGEIDVVCREGKVLVFVEVRLRRNADFGGAGASITASKQQRIILAARQYLATQVKGEPDCRFDCVLIDGNKLEWIKDAFSAN